MSDPLTLPILPAPANWGAGAPTLLRRHRTTVAPAQPGREERTARWPHGAWALRFTADTQHRQAGAAALGRFLSANLGQPILVPIWPDAVFTTAPVTTAVLAVTATTHRLFDVARAIVLYHPETDAVEALALESVAATELTATAAPAGSFPAGTLVLPAFVSEPVTEDVLLTWLTGYQAQVSLHLREAVADAAPLPDPPAVPIYRGVPLVPFPINWADAVEETATRLTESKRDDAGAVNTVVYESATRLQPRGFFLLQTRAQIAQALAWFDALRGQWAPTWAPSAHPAFTLATAAGSGTTLTVHATGYAAGDFAKPWRRFLLIRTWPPAPTWYARKITAAVDNGNGTETLTLDSAVPALAVQSVIHQLYFARSKRDELALEFRSGALAPVEVEFNELPLELTAAISSGTDDASGGLDDDGGLGETEPGDGDPEPELEPPATPANLAGAATNATTVSLGWSPAARATSYQIFRDGVLVRTQSGTSWLNTGLTAATTYQYQVAAVNDAGVALSDLVTVTTPPVIDPPVPPTRVPTTLTLAVAPASGVINVATVVTASLLDQFHAPLANVVIRFSVAGANSATGAVATDAAGQAAFSYTGATAGLDTITAYADADNDASHDEGEPAATATRTYQERVPTTLTLSLSTAAMMIGSATNLSALVRDQLGAVMPGIRVRLTVTGANTASAAALTGADGRATLGYTGTTTGADTLTVYADTNDDAERTEDEPQAVRAHEYVGALSVTLEPSGSGRNIFALFQDELGPVEGVLINFRVTVPNPLPGQPPLTVGSGTDVTDETGVAGMFFIGSGTLTVFADLNENGTRELNEPQEVRTI